MAPPAGPSHSDGPPPGHTGGFGEPTCRACHADNPPDAPGGSLQVAGLPDQYTPGATYRLRVSLRRAGLRRAGFELAARRESGENAGWFRTRDSAVTVTAGPRGTGYAHHTRVGSRVAGGDSTAWMLEWMAPQGAVGAVLFHAVGNAANDDASEFGDFIYTFVARVPAPPPPPPPR